MYYCHCKSLTRKEELEESSTMNELLFASFPLSTVDSSSRYNVYMYVCATSTIDLFIRVFFLSFSSSSSSSFPYPFIALLIGHKLIFNEQQSIHISNR